MSRRTKLIIAAIFLVLLAIPAAYVAISWRPANPLQFRLKSITTISDGEGDQDVHRTWISLVTVENRSSFPIYFYGGEVSAPHAPRDFTHGLIYTVDIGGLLDSSPGRVLIPAHGKIDVAAFSQSELGHSIQKDSLYVQYEWQSNTRDLAAEAVYWIWYHGPPQAREIIPEPHRIRDTAALETKGHALVPPPAPVPSAP